MIDCNIIEGKYYTKSFLPDLGIEIYIILALTE